MSIFFENLQISTSRLEIIFRLWYLKIQKKHPKKSRLAKKQPQRSHMLFQTSKKLKVSQLCSYDVQKNYRHARTSGTWNQAIPRLAFLAIFSYFFTFSDFHILLQAHARACGCRARVKSFLGARRDYSWIIYKNRVHSRDS